MTQIQLRRGTAAQWTTANTVLAAGEVGVETDTHKMKVGDGTTAWTALAYSGSAGEPTITGGTTSQYWRGDKSFQTLNQDAVPDGTTNKAYSATDKTRLATTSGTNTGDQDLSGKLSTSAVVDNADGTISVGSVTGMEPLTPAAAILTASTAPAIGKITLYNATSGNLTPTLPALSGIAAGRRLAVRRDPVDVSTNTVTFSTAGGDTFYSSGSTSFTLPLSGEQREFQVISVSGTKYWAPAGSLNPLAGLDARYIPAATTLRRPVRNTVVAIGDSITAWQSQGYMYPPLLGDMYMNHICVETFQRVRYAGVYATGGYNLGQIQSTLLPQVLALNPLPGACFILGGTNDVANSGQPGGIFSLSFTAGLLRSIVSPLLNAGIVPILVTIPSRTDSTTFNTNAVKFNQWLRRYASTNGFPLVDMYTAVTATNGVWKSGYNFDTIHPNELAHKATAQQAISDGLTDIFPPAGSVLTSRSTVDLSTMLNDGTINQGLFTVDTNSDGVADGLTKTGSTSVASVVAPTTADNINGNWQQLTRTTGGTGSATLQKQFTTGWSVGDVIAFSARVQTENINTTQTKFYVRLFNAIPGGYTTLSGSNITQGFQGIQAWLSDVDDGLVYVEAPVPAGATTLYFQMQLDAVTNAGTPKLRVAEVTVVNLTTGGLLV